MEINVLKEKLARACRMLEMIDLIDFSGHISARLPGSSTFFIHPAALSRSMVKPGDMIETSLKGEKIEGKADIPGETPIHAAVYQARKDVNCVLHMHPHYTIIPSIAGRDLIPVVHHGSIFGAVVPVYPDSEKITTFEQADKMAKILGNARAVVMRGHGAVVTESGIEAVFVAALHLEENARALVEASIMGKPAPLSADEIKRAAANTYTAFSIEKTWAYHIEKGRKDGIFWD